MAASESTDTRGRGRRKRRGCLVVMVVLGAAVAFFFWVFVLAPAPRARLVGSALSKTLGADVRLSGVHIGQTLSIERVEVFDLPRPADAPPTVVIEGIDLEYRIRPADRRHFPRLSIEGLSVNPDGVNPADTSYDFLVRLLSAPSSDFDPTPYLPKQLSIGTLDIEASYPGMGLNMALRDTPVKVHITSLDQLAVSFKTYHAEGSWWFDSPEPIHNFQSADFDVALTVDGGHIEAAPMRVLIPEWLDVEGTALIDTTTENVELAVTLDALRVAGLDLYGIAPTTISYPVAFDSLDLSGTTVNGIIHSDSIELPDTVVNLKATGLQIGPELEPVYEGDLILRAHAENADSVTGTVTLNDGQELAFEVDGGLQKGRAELGIDSWSYGDCLSALPPGARSQLQMLTSLREFSGHVRGLWELPQLSIAGTLTPVFVRGDDVEEQPEIAFQAHGNTDDDRGPLESLTVAINYPDESLHADLSVPEPARMTGVITLAEVEPNRWLQTLADVTGIKDLNTRVSGTVDMTVQTDPASLAATLNLTGSPFSYGAVALPAGQTVAVNGDAALDETFRELRGAHTVVNFGNAASLALNHWMFSTQTLEAAADVAGSANLTELGALLGLSDLWGDITFGGPLRNQAGVVSLEMAVESPLMGYGDFVTPYGTSTRLSGALRFDTFDYEGSVSGVELSLGPGTSLRSPEITFGVTPPHIEAPFAVTTDFEAPAALGYLTAGAGTATVQGDIRYTDDQGVEADLALSLDASSLILPDALAGILNAVVKAQAVYNATGLAGDGVAQASEIAVAGTFLRDADVTLSFSGPTLYLRPFSATVLGGRVNGEAAVDVLTPALGVRCQGAFEDIDLARFTQDFQPPDLYLTGTANGTFAIELSDEGLEDITAEIRSTGGFSMNRDMVKQVLLSEYVTGFAGSGKLNKILEKIVGTDEQRPFDQADLDIWYGKGRIQGIAKLVSDDLTLSIDLKVDPEALAEGLKLRQDAQLEKLDKISADPLRFD